MAGFQSPVTRDNPGTTVFRICKALCAGFGRQLRAACKIPTGVRKAGNQIGIQRINSIRMHDGNRLGRVHYGKGRGGRYDNDYVDIQSNHLRRKLLEALSLTSCIAALDDEVAALLVPVFTQALEQCVIKAFMSVGDKSHPPNFCLACCARAKSGHAAAPPTRVMNSRRLIAPPPRLQVQRWYQVTSE